MRTIPGMVEWLRGGDIAEVPDLPGQPGGWVEITRTNVAPHQMHRDTPDPVRLDGFRLTVQHDGPGDGPGGAPRVASPHGPDQPCTLLVPAGTPIRRLDPTAPEAAPDAARDDELPHYVDDPLVDRKAHRLSMEVDPVASALAGRDLTVGTCSCGQMPPTPPWDDYAVFEAYELHMGDVQRAIRHPDPAAPTDQAKE